MDHNAYQLLALGARYRFVLLAAVLVWRGFCMSIISAKSC